MTRLNKAKAIQNQFNIAYQYYEKNMRDFEENCFNKKEEIDIDEMSK